ncbi:IclR family transcriptional regulator [Pseudonocardia acidicola]|uniref:IclR family transcriptional regulator n=1 Tax=Pseudonocardia acidicola TaxID=2724939 RepID=A0ABX1SCC1_9PSEU|nr:IclR family transcriptional regulator [Pseudonocardia acidicola]NMH97894.1 IclR family transcriptional regulator [Pseudonocardia acidicola]
MRDGNSVQSVDRALDLLELMAAAGGTLGLSELAARSGLPLPTIHRLVRTMVNRGYLRQDPSRRYALGPRLIPLGDTAGRMLGTWARPYLEALVQQVGETANLAMLEGDSVVYVAQVPSPHSMRMFTEVGRRVLPHSTGVGKALLSTLPAAEVGQILRRTGMPAQTEKTITSPEDMLAELGRIRERGYAIDDGEQEMGVRCVAVPLGDAPLPVAISVSGPSGRLTSDRVGDVGRLLLHSASELAAALRAESPT